MSTTATCLHSAEIYVVEQMIAAHGIALILDALAEIASEKAQHIEEAWQDKGLARLWNQQAKGLEALAAKARKERI